MKSHPVLLGFILTMGMTACGSAPMSISQGNSNLLIPPSRNAGIGSDLGAGARVGGDSVRRGGPGRSRVGITALRNAITQGILANYLSSPDHSYSVTNLTFAEPEGAWQQMPFRATLSLIGIAGPAIPVSQSEVTGIYDRLSGRVNLIPGGAQPVDPRVV